MTTHVAAELCRVTLMGVFPALVEHDFATFCRSIAHIRHVIGAYFGPSQGGPFTSKSVAEVITCLRHDYGLTGLGQTSWGPTAFAFVDERESAETIVLELRKRFDGTPGLRFSAHQACNHGAVISHTGQGQRSPRAAASMS
jgi:predicted sugar kinase